MEIKSTLRKIDYGFLLSLLVIFVSVWININNTIMLNSVNYCEKWSLLCYGLVHYICTILIIMILIIFYSKGIILIIPEQKWGKLSITIIEYSLNMLFHNWLPLLILSLSIILLAIGPISLVFVLAIPICLIAIYCMFKVQYVDYEATAFVTVLLVLSCGVFLIIMIWLSSNIAIKTNKESYYYDDEITLAIIPNGYIFLPQLKSIQINKEYSVELDKLTINHFVMKVDKIDPEIFAVNYQLPLSYKVFSKPIKLFINKSIEKD